MSSTLDVEYLEIVTCTSDELEDIKKPVNGRLYHTTDTNEFYYDWNNRRHLLDIFYVNKNNETDGGGLNVSTLSQWLKDNDYVTNVSILSEVKNIIDNELKNFVTNDELNSYANEKLLTKDNFGFDSDVSNYSEEIKSLKSKDNQLYNYIYDLDNKLKNSISELDKKVSSDEFNSKIDGFITKALVESTYLSKEDANTIYVDKNKLSEYLKKSDSSNFALKNDVASKDYITNLLNDYGKKIWIDKYYIRKVDGKDINSYLLKDEASKIYLSKNDSNNFLSLDKANSIFITKEYAENKFLDEYEIASLLSDYALNEDLENYGKKVWVEKYYMRKGKKSDNMDDYILSTEVSEKYYDKKETDSKFITNEIALSTYITKENADKYFISSDKLNGALSNYISKDDETYAKKVWVDEYYMKKGKKSGNMDDYLLSSEANSMFLSISNADIKYLSKDDADKKYITKEEFIDEKKLEEVVKKYISNIDLSDFSKKVWVDEYYMRKEDMDDYLLKTDAKSTFLTEVKANEKYLSKSEASSKYIEIKDAEKEFINNEILNSVLLNYVSKEDIENYAKKVWVDEYYARKSDIESIKNAMVLSNDYDTYNDLYNNIDNVKQGFYYLNDDDNLVIVVDNKNGDRLVKYVNGSSPVEFHLYFGGDNVEW